MLGKSIHLKLRDDEGCGGWIHICTFRRHFFALRLIIRRSRGRKAVMTPDPNPSARRIRTHLSRGYEVLHSLLSSSSWLRSQHGSDAKHCRSLFLRPLSTIVLSSRDPHRFVCQFLHSRLYYAGPLHDHGFYSAFHRLRAAAGLDRRLPPSSMAGRCECPT